MKLPEGLDVKALIAQVNISLSYQRLPHTDIEDLRQQIVLNILRAISERGLEPTRNYIITSVRNAVTDAFRKDQRNPLYGASLLWENDNRIENTEIDVDNKRLLELYAKEYPHDWELLVFAYVKSEKSLREQAEELGVKYNTYKTNLLRARAKLEQIRYEFYRQ